MLGYIFKLHPFHIVAESFLYPLQKLFKAVQPDHSAIGIKRLPVGYHYQRFIGFVKLPEYAALAVGGQQSVDLFSYTGNGLIKSRRVLAAPIGIYGIVGNRYNSAGFRRIAHLPGFGKSGFPAVENPRPSPRQT